MLYHLMVYDKDGTELLSLTTNSTEISILDSTLLKNFLDTIKITSYLYTDVIHQINYFDKVIYIKSYQIYSIILVVNDLIDIKVLEGYFSSLVEEITQYQKNTHDPRKEKFNKLEGTTKKIFAPLMNTNVDFLTINTLKEKQFFLKVGILGLAKVGKTSILRKFFDNWKTDMFENITGTVGIETTIKFEKFLRKNLHIFDFGGQKRFIDSHLVKKDIWKNFTLIIFVIDLTTPENFETSIAYLSSVMNLIDQTNPNKRPKITLLLHKFDAQKQQLLQENVEKVLELLSGYLEKVSFFLTNIYDNSSNIALIQSFYYSLPKIFIELILNEIFLPKFKNEILLPFFSLDWISNFNSFIKNFEKEIHQMTEEKSTQFGLDFQKHWLDALIGEFLPYSTNDSSDLISLMPRGHDHLIRIHNWTEKKYSSEIVTKLLTWSLEGVFKTFFLLPPEFIGERDNYFYWSYNI